MSSLYLDPKSESPIKVHKSRTIGRDFLRIAGPDYKYVSHEQFKIKEKGKDWYIEPIPGTTNSTYLNGKELTGEKRLRDGDEILIGDINTGVGVNLKVVIDSDFYIYGDIVFLVDANSSMKSVVNDLKGDIDHLITNASDNEKINIFINMKVIPFKDVWKGGQDAIDLSKSFVRESQKIKRQLDGIRFSGNNKSKKSVLDAIYLSIKNTDWIVKRSIRYFGTLVPPEPPSRADFEGKKYIVLISNSPFQEEMHKNTVERDEDRSLNRVFQLLSAERINLYLFASKDEIGKYKKFKSLNNCLSLNEISFKVFFDDLIEHLLVFE